MGRDGTSFWRNEMTCWKNGTEWGVVVLRTYAPIITQSGMWALVTQNSVDFQAEDGLFQTVLARILWRRVSMSKDTADGPKANKMKSIKICTVRIKSTWTSEFKIVPVCRKWDKRWKTQWRQKQNRESEREGETERVGGKNIERQRNKINTFPQEPFTWEICHTTKNPLRNNYLFG